ncbi:MAG: nucleoside phosphorylase [Desulfobulbales bacterium]|nr:nucleoside phosphorylase [Desulfobulbales bacterium]
MAEEIIINPRREKGEPILPAAGLFCVNPGEARYLGAGLAKLGAARHFLFNSNLLVLPGNSGSGGVFLAGPAVGAPMAALTLEKLIALGAERIIVCGWCGSLSPELRTGDILLPTWGFSEEGTSGHYPIQGRPASSEPLRDDLARYFRAAGLACREGPVWTTDAPYRETRGKVSEYAGKSILGVDMEFSAMAAVATYRSIDLAAVFLVSDQLWQRSWRPGYKSKVFLAKTRQVFTGLLAKIIDNGNDHGR